MIVLAKQVIKVPFVRYFIASVGALAVDMGSFLMLLQTPVPPGVSGAIAYSLGIVANWLLLSRSVFQAGTADRGRERTRQKAVFLGTTWIGLAMTSGIIGLADLIGANVVTSKIFAVIVSFAFNYFVRKHFIFGAQQRAI